MDGQLRSADIKFVLRRALICSTLLATGWYAPVAAQSATTNIPPPSQYVLDENGVNTATGQMQVPTQKISIGAVNDLFLFEDYNANTGPFHNFHLDIFASSNIVGGKDVTASVLGSGSPRSEGFKGTSPNFTSNLGDGATLSVSGSIYTVTTRDGVKYTYGNTDLTSADALNGNSWAGRISDITYPDGRKLNFYYKKITYTCVNNYCSSSGASQETKVRLQSVLRSDGYQIHFNYISNATGTSQQQYDWDRLSSVVAFNRASEYCDPSADTCSLSSPWPTISYQVDPATGAISVATPSGTSKYLTTYTPSLTFSYQRPGASSYNVVATFNSGRVATVQKDGLTWQYAWSVVTDPYAYPVDSVVTATRTNPNGTTRTTVTHLNIGLPSSVTDEAGKTWAYEYDSKNRVVKATAPEGQYTTTTYDDRGNIINVTNVAKAGSGLSNQVVTAGFSTSCVNVLTCNKPIWTKDAAGNQTDYTYDGNHGGVLTITSPADASGVRPQLRYSYSTKQAYFKNASGSIVASGLPVYKKTIVSTCVAATSGNPGSCVGTTSERKITTDYGAQAAGTANNLLPLTSTSAAGDGSSSTAVGYGYDAVGNRTTIDGPLSGAVDTTRYRYDTARQLIGVVSADPDGGGARVPLARRTTYNADGDITLEQIGTVADQSDTAWSNFSEAYRRTWSYDANGRVNRAKVTSGGVDYAVQDFVYDNMGRQSCSIQYMNPTNWGAQATSCAPFQTTGPNGPDRVVQLAYDALSRVTTVTEGVGTSASAVTLTNTYTNNGKVGSVKDGQNNLTTYVYDGFDRLSQTKYPVTTPGANSSSTTDYEQLTYDANSHVTQRRLRDGGTVSFGYDNLGRVTSRTENGTLTRQYGYNLLGQLTNASWSGGGSAETLTYDALGRLAQRAEPYDTLTYQYNAAGNRTRVTWGDGFYAAYDYDTIGGVTAIRENGATSGVGVLASFTYDNLGRRTSMVRGNGSATYYGYDAISRLSCLTLDLAGGGTPNCSPSASGSDRATTFAYNPAGQIASTAQANDLYAWNGSVNTNRNYGINGLNQYTSAGSTSFSYDGRGNLTLSGSTSYSYDAMNHLTSSNAGASYIEYGSLDELQGLNPSGGGYPRYASDGGNITSEYTWVSGAPSPMQRRYVYAPGIDEPIVWYEGSGTSDRRFLAADERGSIVSVTDSSGNVLATNRYDEFGIPASTNVGRFQYTGQAWIAELGMYYYKARMYSPTLGRFMQTDPIGYGDGLNWYNYAHSDPVNGTDPSGMDDIDNKAPYLSEIVVVAIKGPSLFPDSSPAPLGIQNFQGVNIGQSVNAAPQDKPQNGKDIVVTAAAGMGHNGGPPLDDIVVTGARSSGLRWLGGIIGAIIGDIFFPDPACCFTAGTLVDTPTGLKAIETLRVGDIVISRDPSTGATMNKPIVGITPAHERHIWTVTVSYKGKDGRWRDERYETTDDHPWRTEDGRWVTSAALKQGQSLARENGTAIVVSVVDTGKINLTYNLTIADFHTYFVGQARTWVHNQCGPSVGEAQRAFRTDRNFREYFHRWKQSSGLAGDGAGTRNSDLSGREMLEAYEDWIADGRPGR